MKVRKYDAEIKQLISDLEIFLQAQFAADPNLQEIHLGTQELCDALYAAGVRLIFSDNMISRYLTQALYYRKNNKWIFRRRLP